MKIKLSTAVFLISITVFSSGAFAKKPKHARETYSATTDEGSELEGTQGQLAPAYIPRSLQNAPMNRPQAYARLKKKNSKLKLVSTRSESQSFDPVPPAQAESIAQRLKLVEILIRKYGRAYDYRMHTLRDLESILMQLDAAVPFAPDANRNTMSPAPTAPGTVPPALQNDDGLEDSDSAARSNSF